MPTKYSVTALDRRGIGHPNCWRTGRSWPSGQEVIVDVLDQDEDPILEKQDDEGVMRRYPDPLRIGRKALAALRADKQLMVKPVGNAPDEAEVLQTTIADLQAALAGAVARAELAEREIVRLKADLVVQAKLADKVADLEAQLDEATSPALPPGPVHSAAPSVRLDIDAPSAPIKKRK